MSRPPVFPVEDKFRLVLTVVSGELTIVEAARRGKASEQTISNWKRQFLEGGKQGLADGGRPGSSPQLQRLEAELEDSKAALGEAHVELRVWKKSAEHRLGPTRRLEVIRPEPEMPTARFTRLIGVPERSYRRWQRRERQGRPVKGPWPTPSADRIEPTALAYADRYPQWGSKTIAMLMRADGHYGPNATVYRALRRNGRVLEANYQAERRQHAEMVDATGVRRCSRRLRGWVVRVGG